MTDDTPGSAAPAVRNDHYVVVARRYRPQAFADLVGQEHIAQALTGAITQGRVGHAYLFTGARGVGKTSAARIFAKALNCVTGPTATPCNVCDVCRSVSSGDDLDVLEIDGASNRGIDEIRELRQNVNVRASRSRYKIYIIDEVHMLTREAFNALLKTLEEPPEHVKFIFCTTEAEKIPITILSRCQRFDFSGIQTVSIVGRLRQIVTAEQVAADDEALEIIARRAAGSMRDSQSLLEQLLACGGDRLTVADVNQLLGTADDKRLGQLVSQIAAGDAAAALAELDAAAAEGVDVAGLLDQLLGYYRDLMVAAAGGTGEQMLFVSRAEQPLMAELARQAGLDTILAAMQVIEATLGRLRYTTRGRTLVELAVVRLCRLGHLQDLADLLGQLRDGSLPAGQVAIAPRAAGLAESSAAAAPSLAAELKKKSAVDPPALAAPQAARPAEPTPPSPTTATASVAPSDEQAAELPRLAITADNAGRVWREILPQLTEMTQAMAAEAVDVAISAPNRLVVAFPAPYNSCKTYCERPEPTQQIERALRQATGQEWRVEFAVSQNTEKAKDHAEPPRSASSNRERMHDLVQQPLVRRAVELFGARPVKLDEPRPGERPAPVAIPPEEAPSS